MDISIISPVFNEGDSIEVLVAELIKVLSRSNLSYEIIFVDDGSTDDTFEVLKRLHSQYPNVKALSFSMARCNLTDVLFSVMSIAAAISGISSSLIKRRMIISRYASGKYLS